MTDWVNGRLILWGTRAVCLFRFVIGRERTGVLASRYLNWWASCRA